MNDYEKIMTDYIKSGEKDFSFNLGVEFEHFLVDVKTLRSYKYFEKHGQKEIADALVLKSWNIDYQEDGNILGLSKEGNTITFEPGGQVEISLRPLSSIVEIDEMYKSVRGEVESILTENQALVSIGYHPKTKIGDLPLLPKERYTYMYNYLHTKGDMARNMMKGTAATQVSIDYFSEDDFKKKYRVANFLSPFISRIYDCSPIFEGKKYDEENLRIKIWENTDISRSKMPSGVLDRDFGYKEYAKYILSTSPIIMPDADTFKFTSNKRLDEISLESKLEKNDVLHAMSMVFPDVRVKNFIEVRMPDAVPYPYNIGIAAFIKGIFYNEENLDKYYNFSKNFTDKDYYNLNKRMKRSYSFDYTCLNGSDLNCSEFVLGLIDDAVAALPYEEQLYLTSIKEMILSDESLSKYLKGLYTEDFENFKSEILEQEVQCTF